MQPLGEEASRIAEEQAQRKRILCALCTAAFVVIALIAMGAMQANGVVITQANDSIVTGATQASVYPNAHTKSYLESNGWFNVPDQKWEEMKTIHFMTRNNQIQHPENWNHQGKYMNWNWFASFSCPTPPLRIGSGDGGKVICDPYRLKEDSCLVYSIGSQGDFGFERAIKKWNKNCEIHTFDHTWNPDGTERGVTNYHKIGLGDRKEGNINTLSNIVKDLGHVNRRIDILKIDCEGCETKVHPNFHADGVNIGQLLMEVHFGGYRKPHEDMMESLHQNGFVIFSKEPNTGYSNGAATEFSFLRLNPSVFYRM